MRTDQVEYLPVTGWIDPPTDLQPALAADIECDVAVIGGGMGGMATALRLAERGQDVVLLEAEFCGYGSSSRNGGQIAGAPGGDLRMLTALTPKRMPGVVRLAENAGRFVEGLITTHDIDCEYVPNGLVWGAVSPGQMLRVKTLAAILKRFGGHGQVGTSAELGIPRAFVGGMRESVGGMLNPGKLTAGVRHALLATNARVFEGTPVTQVRRVGALVEITTPGGTVRANTVVLSTNAYAGDWEVAPKRLSVPLYVIEVESEPIPANLLAQLGWTSRSGVITQHQIMTHYRLTERNTLIFGVRRAERGPAYPLPKDKTPDPSLVKDLARSVDDLFPSLAGLSVARAWGGWIAITASWLSVAGRVEDNVYYSIGCNGHGLCQAPYLGSLIADLIVDGHPHPDLQSVWSDKNSYPPIALMDPYSLRAVWAVDRVSDTVNRLWRNTVGSRRRKGLG
jgi:glycine/D-amino acid oxidase-like deaminating enzyme